VPAIGMGLGWLGYSLGLWGWSLLRGYNVTLGQLMSPAHPYSGAWPPALMANTQIFPGKDQSAPAAATAATAPAAATVNTMPPGTPGSNGVSDL
jgi:hypothetical protein